MAVSIGILFASHETRQYFSFIPDNYFNYILEHKFIVGIGTFLVLGQVSSILLTTNAFEITCNNHLIFSKLQTNRMPELSKLMKNNLYLGLQL